jgi:uncharacterized protein YkwD
MTTSFRLVFALFITLAVSLFACIGIASAAADDAGTFTLQTSSDSAGIPVRSATMLREMLDAHNARRVEGGLAALEVDSRLEAIALDRALDMATRNYFDHVSPEGVMAFDLLDAAGYVSYTAGENIALNNYADARSVSMAMNSFMASPTHRKNIMNRNFSRVGMAVAVGANGLKYYAVVFAG